ncbi:hypothetical protein [Paraclostridium bifermentans]
MNKKLSITILGLAVFSFILVLLGVIINQPKHELVDIKGDRNEIGDVLFISQTQNGLYGNVQTITSKDKFTVKKNSKSIYNLSENTKVKDEHKEMFKNVHQDNQRYCSEENIGYIEDRGINYTGTGDANLSFKIVNKNLRSGNVEEYDLNLPKSFDGESNFSYGLTVGIKNEDIYILSSVSEDVEYSAKGNITGSGDVAIDIYKFNLNKKEIDKVGEFVQKKKDSEIIISNNQICFEYEDKLYSTIETYPNDKKKNGEVYLIYYDMEKNKFEYMEGPIINNKDIESIDTDTIQYSIENGKLYLLNKNDKDESYTNIIQYTIDLKNNKIDKNKEYKVEKLNEMSHIESFRVINKKLYLCMGSYKEIRGEYSGDEDLKNTIVVVDEKNGNTLYMGEYIEGKPEDSTNFILKKRLSIDLCKYISNT